MTRPTLDKSLGEMFRHYAPQLDEFFAECEQHINAKPTIGDTTDETLIRTYKRAGELEHLEYIKSRFYANVR